MQVSISTVKLLSEYDEVAKRVIRYLDLLNCCHNNSMWVNSNLIIKYYDYKYIVRITSEEFPENFVVLFA